MLRVTHVIASLSREAAGVGSAVSGYADKCQAFDIDSIIVGLETATTAEDNQCWGKTPTVSCKQSGLVRSFGFSASMKKSIEKLTPELIHSHGLWMYPGVAARQAAKSLNVPLLISPHGMYMRDTMKFSPMKKKLALALFEKKNFSSADCFHVTAEQEAEELRALGITKPIAVVPIGIDLPERGFLEKYKENSSKRTLLFMSRLHAKKGLELLFKVWAQIYREFPQWQILIAGPDEGGYQSRLEGMVKELGLSESVHFRGAVYGEEKNRLLANADAFVLPSLSENFGIVIAEALAYEVPVLTTDRTPWKDIDTHKCGWYIPYGEDELRQGLKDLCNSNTDILAKMGGRGRCLVDECFSWKSASDKMAATYRWLVGRQERPEWVSF
jgi:glycosyltransferase involved in cell wall biosynthesis